MSFLARTPIMQVRLEVSHDKANVKRVVLSADAVIGRSSACNLRIASNLVSRRHCKVTLADGGVLVRDLESSNGTFVDGRRLSPHEDALLPSGSTLSVGGVQFVVRYDAPESARTTAAAAIGPGSTVDLPLADALAVEPDDSQSLAAVGETSEALDAALPQPVMDPPAAVEESEPVPSLEAILDEEPVQEAIADIADSVDEDAVDTGSFEFSDVSGDSEEAAVAEEGQADEPEPQLEPKRRSLFGFLGRKKASRQAPEPDPEPAETEDEESALPEPAAAEETICGPDETITEPLPAEEPLVSEAAEHVSEDDMSEDDVAGFLAEMDSAGDEDEQDDELGDFLRKLGPD